MIKDLLLKSRSYRRYHQEIAVGVETLREFVDTTRYCPSGSNKQPLKYILSNEPTKNALIFQHLRWAKYLDNWPGPNEGERPPAYIIILGDTKIKKSAGTDASIAAHSIVLAAVEKGLGGCIISGIEKEGLGEAMKIPPHYEILFVVTLGKPKETVVLEEVGSDGDVRYWRDKDGVHHVPKRSLGDIILD